MNRPPIYGHVLFEGSSETVGYKDEERRKGFAGRIEDWAQKFNGNWPNDPRRACVAVATYPRGVPGQYLPDYVMHVGNHIKEVRARGGRRFSPRIVGVFAVAGWLDATAKRFNDPGPDFPVTSIKWQRALGKLKHTVVRSAVEVAPIVVGFPKPPEGATMLAGGAFNSLLHEKLGGITDEFMTEQWPTANYIKFQDLIPTGEDPMNYVAPDKIHPNARGYQLLANAILPTLQEEFQINPKDYPLVNPE